MGAWVSHGLKLSGGFQPGTQKPSRGQEEGHLTGLSHPEDLHKRTRGGQRDVNK